MSNDDNTLDHCPISRSEIVRLAENLTIKFREFAGDRAYLGINFQNVFDEFIYPKYEVKLIDHIDLGRDEDGNEILGQYDAETNHLFFSPCLRNDHRRTFTYWHEIGHIVLHGEWLRRLIQLGSRSYMIRTTERSLSPQTIQELEVQANIFASYTAAPTWLLRHAFLRTFKTPYLMFTGPGTYSFCLSCGTQTRHISDFSELCNQAAHFMTRYFGGLSQQALGYRIEGSDLVVNRLTGPGIARLNRAAKKNSSQRAFAF